MISRRLFSPVHVFSFFFLSLHFNDFFRFMILFFNSLLLLLERFLWWRWRWFYSLVSFPYTFFLFHIEWLLSFYCILIANQYYTKFKTMGNRTRSDWAWFSVCDIERRYNCVLSSSASYTSTSNKSIKRRADTNDLWWSRRNVALKSNYCFNASQQ